MTSSQENAHTLETVAAQFRELMGSMAGPSGVLDVEAVVRYAAASVDGADHSAITLSRSGSEPRTIASSSEVPQRVDALQYQLDEGPCVAALSENDMVWINDLTVDETFPRFGPGAVALGVRSMLSTRLLLSENDRAALNLYSHRARAFTVDQLPLAAIYGSFASLVLISQLQENRIMNLDRALASNREIGVAIGILMSEQRCTREQAFDQLARVSQNLNRRLHDIADEVNQTGRLPQR
jgi:hypothetical protein